MCSSQTALFTLLLTVLRLDAAGAQTDMSPAIIAELGAAHAVVSGDLQAAAEKMPAEKYSFTPVAGIRTFGQIVAHVAGGQFLYCSQGGGLRLDPEMLKKLSEVRPYSNVETAAGSRTYPKEELVALLEASTAFCLAAYSKGTARDAKALKMLIDNIAHNNEHYGNVVIYLRLNGIVPPSTERAKAGGR
jgi:uncharacterized damage-inducible protein DinB